MAARCLIGPASGAPAGFRLLVLGLGLASAALYTVLMPLWEGYGEPFHYGIVQAVWITHAPADPRSTPISEELWQSRLLAPVSPVFQTDSPPIKTFGEFYKMPASDRLRQRTALREIPTELQYRSHGGPPNYEAQQPPLCYALLAVPDRLLAGAPILTRVLALRLLIALFTVVMVAVGTFRLGEELGIQEVFLAGAVSLVFMTQTFLGAVCRISNDWLGIALAPWLVVNGIRLLRRGSTRNAMAMGACLAAGLLGKANYLAFVPLAAGVAGLAFARKKLPPRGVLAFLATLGCAAPWYVRNIVVFHSLTGWHPHLGNTAAGGALAALKTLPWMTYLPSFGRVALWNGNNHYLAFSKATMDVILVLLLVAAALTAWHVRRTTDRRALLVTLAGVSVYGAALAYSIGELHVLYPEYYALAPWYCPPLFPLLFPLLFWGLSRSGGAGRWTAIALVAVCGYVLVATWLVKLIPLYAGFPDESVKLGRLVAWYATSWRDAHEKLSLVALGPVWQIYALTCVSVSCVVAILLRSVRISAGAAATRATGRS